MKINDLNKNYEPKGSDNYKKTSTMCCIVPNITLSLGSN